MRCVILTFLRKQSRFSVLIRLLHAAQFSDGHRTRSPVRRASHALITISLEWVERERGVPRSHRRLIKLIF